MEIKKVAAEVEVRTGIKKMHQAALGASIATNLLLILALVIGGRTHRETIIPPQVAKTFWVEDSHASPEYLEMMTKFAVDLAMTNTPASCQYNAKTLLTFVGSGSYGEIQKQLNANCKQLIDNGASTQYIIREFNFAKGRDNEAVIQGTYMRWIAERKVYEQNMAFYVRFAYSSGRMYVYDISPITDNPNPISMLDPIVNPVKDPNSGKTVNVQTGGALPSGQGGPMPLTPPVPAASTPGMASPAPVESSAPRSNP